MNQFSMELNDGAIGVMQVANLQLFREEIGIRVRKLGQGRLIVMHSEMSIEEVMNKLVELAAQIESIK